MARPDNPSNSSTEDRSGAKASTPSSDDLEALSGAFRPSWELDDGELEPTHLFNHVAPRQEIGSSPGAVANGPVASIPAANAAGRPTPVNFLAPPPSAAPLGVAPSPGHASEADDVDFSARKRTLRTRWIASAIVTVGVVVIVLAFVSSRSSDESRPTTTVQAGTAEAPTSAPVVPSSNDIPYAALPPVASTPAVPALEPSHDVVMPSFQRGATSHGTNAGATPAVKISPPATTRVREASASPSPAGVTGAEAPAPGPATRPKPSTTIVHDLPF